MRNGGVTLVELVVVLALIGLVASVSGLALSSLKPPREAEWARELRRARTGAVQTGKLVRSAIPLPSTSVHDRPLPSLFLPDGRAIGAAVDPLTGAPRATR